MAVNNIIGAVAGGIVGGVLGYTSAKEAARKKRKAVEKAAKMLREANEKYSGKAANASMTNAGLQEMNNLRDLTGAGARNYDIEGGTQYAAGANAANTIRDEQSQAGLQGYELGANNQATLNQAELTKVQNQINNDLKQADVDYNVDVAKQQAMMSGVSGLADLYKNMKPASNSSSNSSDMTFNHMNGWDSSYNSDEQLKETPEDGIDDDKLLEAINKFKSLSAQLYDLKPILMNKR